MTNHPLCVFSGITIGYHSSDAVGLKIQKHGLAQHRTVSESTCLIIELAWATLAQPSPCAYSLLYYIRHN